MKVFSLVAFISVIVVAIALVLPVLNNPKRGGKKDTTFQILGNVSTQIEYVLQNFPTGTEFLLSKENNNLLPNKEVLHFLNLAGHLLPIIDKASESGSINDAWGNPLNFANKSGTNAPLLLNLHLLRTSKMIVIWSSGENGSNEFGNGDDVFLQKYTQGEETNSTGRP